MAFAANAYSNYFRAIQSPVCAVFGPTGPAGSGSTGATGATGPAGTNGISTGLIYYFHAQSVGGQPNQGDTGFAMNTSIQPGPVGGNPVYLPTVYNGYFSSISPTAGTSGPALLGDFKTSVGDPGVTVIPAGSWTFLMNIYTGIDYTGPGHTGITGSAGTSINVYAEVWKTSQGVSSLIGDNKSRSIIVNSATDDQLYSMGVTIQTAQTLFTPSVDSMFVRIYAVPTTSTFIANQRIEFWTDGDSVSQVTTTLPAKSGNSGPTGAVGPTGAIGLPGTPGANGSQGIQGPMGQSNWTPVLNANMVASVTDAGTFTATAFGAPAWGSSQVSSLQGFPQAYASFTVPSPSTTNSYVGLATVTSGDAFANTYSIYNYGAGGINEIRILENSAIPTLTISNANVLSTDVFIVKYDGVNLTYYRNGTLLKTTLFTLPSGSVFYLRGQHSIQSTSFANVVFGSAGSSSSPLVWSYVLVTTNGSLTPRIVAPGQTGQGIASGDLVNGWSAAGTAFLPIPALTPENLAFPYSYEPPGLSMLSRFPNTLYQRYCTFTPQITGLYQVTINLCAAPNSISDGFPNGLSFIRLYSPNGIGVPPGSGLDPGTIIPIENLCNTIFISSGVALVASSTTFICNMVVGSEYAVSAGSFMNNSRAFPVYNGTQIQFKLLPS